MDRKALTEVYSVLIKLDKKDYEKIPSSLISAIKSNLDENYEVDDIEIEKGNMLEDTEKILTVIYTDYLANEEEKNTISKLQEIDRTQTNLIRIRKNNIFSNILKKIKDFFGGQFGKKLD